MLRRSANKQATNPRERDASEESNWVDFEHLQARDVKVNGILWRTGADYCTCIISFEKNHLLELIAELEQTAPSAGESCSKSHGVSKPAPIALRGSVLHLRKDDPPAKQRRGEYPQRPLNRFPVELDGRAPPEPKADRPEYQSF